MIALALLIMGLVWFGAGVMLVVGRKRLAFILRRAGSRSIFHGSKALLGFGLVAFVMGVVICLYAIYE